MPAKEQGLFNKFTVLRTDRRDRTPGQKHYGCAYFVLDLTHDPHAILAIQAYAYSCRESYPLLARDLYAKAEEMKLRLADHPEYRSIVPVEALSPSTKSSA